MFVNDKKYELIQYDTKGSYCCMMCDLFNPKLMLCMINRINIHCNMGHGYFYREDKRFNILKKVNYYYGKNK